MQEIDRRVIYAVLVGCILVPLFLPQFQLPIVPAKQAVDFYQTLETTARTEPNKLVLVDSNWASSTRGESGWQARAVLTHLMQRHLHFALLAFEPQNPVLTQQLMDTLAPRYGYVYGRDYVNWGYRPAGAMPQTLKALVNDIPGTIKTDWHGKPLAQFPIMQGVHDIKDISVIVDITPIKSAEYFLGLVQGVNKTPYLLASTAVMAPTYYPYLDSGQITGMLTGVKGAGDYEKLTGVHAFGTRAAGALSLVYVLLIVLILIGNIGYHVERAAARKREP